jgi:hypothetical protein
MSWREPIVLLYHDENQLFCYNLFSSWYSRIIGSGHDTAEQLVLVMIHQNNWFSSWYSRTIGSRHDTAEQLVLVMIQQNENQLFCFIMTRTNVFCCIMTRTNCSAISWREPIVLLCHDENQLFCYIMTMIQQNNWFWSWYSRTIGSGHDIAEQLVLVMIQQNNWFWSWYSRTIGSEPIVLLCHDENQLFCYVMTRTNCFAVSWREPIVLLYHDENPSWHSRTIGSRHDIAEQLVLVMT